MERVREFARIPGALNIFFRSLRSLVRKNSFSEAEGLPEMSASVKNHAVHRNALKAYRAVCGLEDDGHIPVLYPHVLTGSLQMSIFTDRKFPLPLVGTLHLRNHIIQFRPVREDELLDIKVSLAGHRIVKRGLEYDYTINIESKGEVVWRSLSTYLRPGKFGTEYTDSSRKGLLTSMTGGSEFFEYHIPDNIGWKYARISSDFNPIHFFYPAARMAGFRGKIAHAMWALSYTLGKIKYDYSSGPVRIDLEFRGPLFTGSEGMVLYEPKDNALRFDYFMKGNERPCIKGMIASADCDGEL